MSKVGHGLTCTEKVAAEGKTRQRVVVEKVNNMRAGLQKGDVLVKMGGLPVKNRFDVERALWGYKVGDKVETAVLRGGKLTTVSLTLGGPESSRVTALSGTDR